MKRRYALYTGWFLIAVAIAMICNHLPNTDWISGNGFAFALTWIIAFEVGDRYSAWRDRDEMRKPHAHCESDGSSYTTNPIQYKCKHCGRFWRYGDHPPPCEKGAARHD